MNITWTLNGRTINIFDGIDTGNTKTRTSQLTIESVQSHHSGEYTCFAQNSLGIAKYCASLNVNGIHMEIKVILFFMFDPSQLNCIFFCLYVCVIRKNIEGLMC